MPGSRTLPAKQYRAPGETSAHCFEQDEVAAADSPVADSGSQCQRHGGRRSISVLIDRDDNLFLGNAELARRGVDDAPVGLMRDKPVETFDRQSGRRKYF